ncbi:hypothetical protein [Larkinella soli]|uniref:hypothetical protein n=1 Tax=Larkinella soli TaxID=1770527 RepID=UPI0013E328D3|nr:hypothetical protein [Larkinella soli]
MTIARVNADFEAIDDLTPEQPKQIREQSLRRSDASAIRRFGDPMEMAHWSLD